MLVPAMLAHKLFPQPASVVPLDQNRVGAFDAFEETYRSHCQAESGNASGNLHSSATARAAFLPCTSIVLFVHGRRPARTPPHSLPRTKFGSAARSCKCAFINPRERGRGGTENPGTVGAPRCLSLGDPQCCRSYLGRVVGGPGRRAAAGALPQNACDRFTGPATRRTGSNSRIRPGLPT
jgi:hypothetical protein